jgi:hypothetical protein
MSRHLCRSQSTTLNVITGIDRLAAGAVTVGAAIGSTG